MYEFLYERTALEALPLLEAAGIETLEDLQLLNADDLAALGIEEITCAHILGVQYTASQRAQQQAVSEEISQPKQSSEATSSSSSSEIIEWLTLAGIPHAEPMLSAQGIERTSDLAMLTVQDVDALNLPDGIGPRLKWALRLPVEEAPLEQPAAEELPPDITAGMGQLMSAELGGPAPDPVRRVPPRPRHASTAVTIFKDETEKNAPPAFLRSESSDDNVMAAASGSRFRPSGLLKGESFIAEEDEDELSLSDDD